MSKRKVNSFNILTPDEKLYLRRISRYLNSYGMDDGSVEVETNESFDLSEIDWEDQSHFSNNYSVEVPEKLGLIFKKISDYVYENNLESKVDFSDYDLNYSRVDMDIDTKKQEISLNFWCSYIESSDSEGVTWDDEEGEKIFQEWSNENILENIELPKNGVLTLTYDGSGDSGYISDSFDENSEPVPSTIEDWCYRQLENHFGGWEINEGSRGQFIFDFNNQTIELVHTQNIETSKTGTVYEESFAQ